MIKNIQISGEPDTHPEKPVHDAYELASGQVDLSSLNIKGHHVEIFDMMDADGKRAYEDLYSTLLAKSKEGKIIVNSNVREVLTRADGSTGWYKYLEWTEFDTSEILGA